MDFDFPNHQAAPPSVGWASWYCGNRECHEYQLYLDNIDHSRTKAKSPQTNGVCERSAKNSIATWTSCSLILMFGCVKYNEKHEHSGKCYYGRTPWQTFLNSKHLAQAKMLDSLTATVSSDFEGQHAEPERSPAQRSGGGAQSVAA
jgi:hypothetical protein